MRTAYNADTEYTHEDLLRDILVVFFALALGIYLAGLYYQDINRGFMTGGTPAGEITALDNNVQRRQESRLVWARLRNAAEVYNGDTIKTGAFSMAVLDLNNGDVLKLGENTMVMVNIAATQARFELLSGRLTAQSQTGSVIVSGGAEFAVSPDGATEAFDDGSGAQVTQTAAIKDIQPRLPELVSPGAGEAIAFTEQKSYVQFRWEPAAREGIQRAWYVEVADNADFTRPVVAKSVWDTALLCTALDAGRWFWRVTPDTPLWDGQARASEFSIVYEDAAAIPELAAPPPGAALDKNAEKIVFSGRHFTGASAYIFEIARDTAFSGIVLAGQEAEPYFLYTGGGVQLERGTYYWRMRAVNAQGASSASAPWNFVITDTAPPPPSAFFAAAIAATLPTAAVPTAAVPLAVSAPPAATPSPGAAAPRKAPSLPPAPPPVAALPPASLGAPLVGATVGVADWLARRRIEFTWEAVAEATDYVFSLKPADGNNAVVEAPLSETRYVLFDIQALPGGEYIWQVEAVARDGNGVIVRRGEKADRAVRRDFHAAGTPVPHTVVEVD
ncbi:MAG: hypothetical protein LBC72_04115 [Spirochaetaceae bacterium]|jgi:hypothetical protein|nr:hypothetical protein [Spirochaetaceae bacterium]